MRSAQGPLRLVTDREQSFRSTHEYPDGWISETLECGHIHIERINPHDDGLVDDGSKKRLARHRDQTKRRRCEECYRRAGNKS